MDEHMDDLLAIVALGGASDEEIEEVMAYVAANPGAAARLAELQSVAAALPFGAEPMPVSAAATDALMTRVVADAARRQEPVTAVHPVKAVRSTVAPHRPTIWETIRQLLAQPAVSGVGLALAAIVVVWAGILLQRVNALESQIAAREIQLSEQNAVVNSLTSELGSLQNANNSLASENAQLNDQLILLQAENATFTAQMASLQEENASQAEQLATLLLENSALQGQVATLSDSVASQQQIQAFFSSPELYTVTLPGTEQFPQAEGQIVIDPVSNLAMLVVTGMDPLPENNVYQVLLIRGTEHETAETFRVSTEGEGVLLVHSDSPLSSFDAVGVSIEPMGGSEQRTGDIIVLGEVLN